MFCFQSRVTALLDLLVLGDRGALWSALLSLYVMTAHVGFVKNPRDLLRSRGTLWVVKEHGWTLVVLVHASFASNGSFEQLGQLLSFRVSEVCVPGNPCGDGNHVVVSVTCCRLWSSRVDISLASKVLLVPARSGKVVALSLTA